MQFCKSHWAQLRQAIDARGLAALVADSGEKAAANLAAAIEGQETIDTFDPLMAAHNAIVGNALSFASRQYGVNPLAMMADNPDHPEFACPICFLNWLHADHDERCTQAGCDWPKGERYEWMIDRAAEGSLERWRQLGEQIRP